MVGRVVLRGSLLGSARGDVAGEEPVGGGACGGAHGGKELDGGRLALHVPTDVLGVEPGALADGAVCLVAEERVEAFVDRGCVHA